MEIYPSTLAIKRPLSIEAEYKTLVTEFDSGKEQRRKVWPFPLRNITFAHRTRQTNTETVWQFYNDRAGQWEPFWFVMPYLENHKNEYVAKGDGSLTIFDLPSLGTSGLTVYVNGTPTAVTFLSGGGQASSDRIQFTTAPANGDTISADFNGKLRFKLRFADDKLTKEMFEYFLYNIGIKLKEVR